MRRRRRRRPGRPGTFFPARARAPSPCTRARGAAAWRRARPQRAARPRGAPCLAAQPTAGTSPTLESFARTTAAGHLPHRTSPTLEPPCTAKLPVIAPSHGFARWFYDAAARLGQAESPAVSVGSDAGDAIRRCARAISAHLRRHARRPPQACVPRSCRRFRAASPRALFRARLRRARRRVRGRACAPAARPRRGAESTRRVAPACRPPLSADRGVVYVKPSACAALVSARRRSLRVARRARRRPFRSRRCLFFPRADVVDVVDMPDATLDHPLTGRKMEHGVILRVVATNICGCAGVAAGAGILAACRPAAAALPPPSSPSLARVRAPVAAPTSTWCAGARRRRRACR